MIRVEQPHLIVAAHSHPGMTGKNNEDRYAVSAYILNETYPVPSVLALVSDGVGGNRAGEVAAEMAVETISRHIAASDGNLPVEIIANAFQAANALISAQSKAVASLQGMGTTCVCAWVVGDQLYAAWVGDSRLYLIRGNSILQLSIDHTFVQDALDQGVLTSEQARNTPARHVIHRYLGSPQPVVPDFRLRLRPQEDDQQAQANQGLRLLPGDRLLLCSDGLTDLVQDAEILAAIARNQLESALIKLVDLANQRGGFDNITLVGLQMPVSSGISNGQADHTGGTTRIPKAILGGCLGVAALLTIAILGLVAGFWFSDRQQATPTSSEPALTVIATQIPALQPTNTGFQVVTPTNTGESQPLATLPQPLTTMTPWPTHTHGP